ncbi:MAG: cell wall hydrolase [Pseudomonadota bacterium]
MTRTPLLARLGFVALLGVLAACEGMAPPNAGARASRAQTPVPDAGDAADGMPALLQPFGQTDGPLVLDDLFLPLSKNAAVAFDPAGRGPLDDPITCLARTVYWEAKGEGDRGMRAVAHVVANRVGSGRFPETFCGVVTAGGAAPPCQFSWWCDGRPDEVIEAGAYAEAREIARQVLNGESADPTQGALFFHNRRVRPSWSRVFRRTATIGGHIFYRPA